MRCQGAKGFLPGEDSARSHATTKLVRTCGVQKAGAAVDEALVHVLPGPAELAAVPTDVPLCQAIGAQERLLRQNRVTKLRC
eukprot:scaffold8038_cov39-Prasinocladus_malaysianus.AAC.1